LIDRHIAGAGHIDDQAVDLRSQAQVVFCRQAELVGGDLAAQSDTAIGGAEAEVTGADIDSIDHHQIAVLCA